MVEEDTCSKKPYIKTLKTCTCKISEGLGPFTTEATYKNAEGRLVKWDSRYHRKHHSQLDKNTGSTWWAPSAVGWWIGVLFAIGATCFALGSTQLYVNIFTSNVYNEIFFIGSIFFTTAAFLQYLEAINAPIHLCKRIKDELRLFAWEPHRVDWWSTVVQFGGTLFFNVSTLAALQNFISINQINRLVWGPDIYGSICFLIASYLAWSEIAHGFWSLKPNTIPWWIAIINLIGSVAFGVSAIAAYPIPGNGLPLNLLLTDLGTFIGAVCFFIGAVLLLPERMIANVNEAT